MIEETIWRILGIEPTKDENEIRSAYKRQLPKFNPEDDPEGFKALREACDEAIRLCREKEKEGQEEEEEKDEVDQWIEQIKAFYPYPDLRFSDEQWDKILSADACQSLDTGLEAREKLLAFLMNHHHLPKSIWEKINKTFTIEQDKETLLERFPDNFLTYVIHNAHNESFPFYEDLVLKPGFDPVEQDIDEYLDLMLKTYHNIEQLDYPDVEPEFKKGVYDDYQVLLDWKLTHPYVRAFGLKLFSYGLLDLPEAEVEETAHHLADNYPKNVYLRYNAGDALLKLGKHEDAKAIFDSILEKDPKNQLGYLGIAKYEFQIGEYEKVSDIIIDKLKDLHNSEQVNQLFRDAHERLEEEKKRRVEENPDDLDAYMELVWSVFRQEKTEEALALLDKVKVEPSQPEYYDYVDIKGRSLLDLRKTKEAVGYLLEWEKAMDALVDDGSDKTRKKLNSRGYMYSIIGLAYYRLKEYDKAQPYLKKATEQETDPSMLINCMDMLALIHLRHGEYEEGKAICNQILEKYADYYPAVIKKQEIAFLQHESQEVVDLYYEALGIYEGYYKPYILAAKVFYYCRQPDNALKVIAAAREKEITSCALRFLEIQIKRNKANTNEEREVLLKELDALRKEVEEDREKRRKLTKERETRILTAEEAAFVDDYGPYSPNATDDDRDRLAPAALSVEKCYLLADMDRMDEAFDYVEQAIEKGENGTGLIWFKADLLRDHKKKYEEALKEYEKLKILCPDDADADYYAGVCLEELNRREEAFLAFTDALKKDPEHTQAHYHMALFYRWRYYRYELLADYDKCVEEFQKVLELNDHPFYHNAFGQFLMKQDHMEEAKKELLRAVELDPEYSSAYYHLSRVHLLLNEFDEALTAMDKAIEFGGSYINPGHFCDKSEIYRSRGDVEGALKVLLTAKVDKADTNKEFQKRIADYYAALGQVDKSIEQVEKMKKLKLYTDEEAEREIERYVFASMDRDRTKEVLKKLRRKISRDYLMSGSGTGDNVKQKWYSVFYHYGTVFMFAKMYDKAVRAFEEAGQYGSTLNLTVNLALSRRMLGHGEKAKKLAEKGLKKLLTENNVPENLQIETGNYVEKPEYYVKAYTFDQPLRYKRIAALYIAMGKYDEAKFYLDCGMKCTRCHDCQHGRCYDLLLLYAYLAEAQGYKDLALEYFKDALAVCPEDEECSLSVMALTEKF